MYQNKWFNRKKKDIEEMQKKWYIQQWEYKFQMHMKYLR